MGLPGLWQMLDRISVRVSLQGLAVDHRSDAVENVQAQSTFILGIDMGPIMRACNGGVRAATVNYQVAGGGLYNFECFLGRILVSPIKIVAVFDGDDREEVKRDHRVVSGGVPWEPGAERLIVYWGHKVIRAPGEAETQLAQMNRDGLINAVLTADSDALLYGAPVVIRPLKKIDQNFCDEFLMYRSEDLGKLELSKNALIMAAISQGADYDHGLKGCGSKTALALGRCGFGDELVAISQLNGIARQHSLDIWRASVKAELLSNSKGKLGGRLSKLASEIGPTFPNLRILNLYLHPIILPADFQFPTFHLPQQPQVDQIANFFRDCFFFDKKTILKRFVASVFEVVCLQAIYSPLACYDPVSHSVKTPEIHLLVSKAAKAICPAPKATGGVADPRVKLDIHLKSLVEAMGSGFTMDAGMKDCITVWPPVAMLPPELAAGVPGSGKGYLEAVHRSAGSKKPRVADADIIEISDDDSASDDEYPADLFEPMDAPPIAGPSHQRAPLHTLMYEDLTDPTVTFKQYRVAEDGAIIVD